MPEPYRDYRIERDRREAEEARRREEAQRMNAEIRRERLTGLAAERQARQDEALAADLAALEPEKTQLRRQWLADHPGHTAEDFERRAWPQLARNLLDRRESEARDRTREQLIAAGAYPRL